MMADASMSLCRTSRRYLKRRVLHVLLHTNTPHTHMYLSNTHVHKCDYILKQTAVWCVRGGAAAEGYIALLHTNRPQTHVRLSNTRVHEYDLRVRKNSGLARRMWSCRHDIAPVPCYRAREQRRIGGMRIAKPLSQMRTSRYFVWTSSAFKRCRCLCACV